LKSAGDSLALLVAKYYQRLLGYIKGRKKSVSEKVSFIVIRVRFDIE
jgi:hypothetical protein